MPGGWVHPAHSPSLPTPVGTPALGALRGPVRIQKGPEVSHEDMKGDEVLSLAESCQLLPKGGRGQAGPARSLRPQRRPSPRWR